MGRAQRDRTEETSLAPAADVGRTSIGRYLAREREFRGISLDELAAMTRLPKRSLERLEAGAYDDAMDGFARGFVRAVSEALGLRPHEALAQMLPEADASEPRPHWPHWLPTWRVCAWIAVGLVAGGAILLAGHRLFTASSAPAPIVYRTDVVRELWLETTRGPALASDATGHEPARESATWVREPAETQSSAAD